MRRISRRASSHSPTRWACDSSLIWASIAAVRCASASVSKGLPCDSADARPTFDITPAMLGARYRHDGNAGAARLSLQGQAEWQRTLAQHGAIEASFTGIDARAPLALDMLGSEVGILGLGLGAQWRTSRLTLDFDARHGQSRTDLGITANWSLRF